MDDPKIVYWHVCWRKQKLRYTSWKIVINLWTQRLLFIFSYGTSTNKYNRINFYSKRDADPCSRCDGRDGRTYDVRVWVRKVMWEEVSFREVSWCWKWIYDSCDLLFRCKASPLRPFSYLLSGQERTEKLKREGGGGEAEQGGYQ